MSIAELVSRLARLDVEMHQRDGRLKIDAPKGVLTQQLRSELVDRKQEILEFLAHNRTSGRPPPALRLERAPRSPGEALPLSFAQERLWFLDHLAAGRAAYNVPMIWSLRGPLDIRLLAASLCLIVRRHEILRARFEMGAGRPVQRIAAAVTVPLPRVDLRQLSAGRRWAEARRLAKAEAMRGFDLTHGQPLRSLLLELGDGSVQLLVTFHHLVVDGSSLGIFQRELQAFYRALAAGWRGAGHAEPLPEPLPEPALQYADYTRWQRRQIDDTGVDEQLAFWRHQLAGVATLELPRDGPRPALPTFGGHRLRFELAPALSEALQSLSRRHGATVFMALLASFATLLHRLTGATDVAVGTPVAGRTRDELASLIGTFANTLVLRSDLTGDPSFVDLLGRARRTALAAFAHQDLPFEKLVEALRPERDPSHSPLFQAMLMIERAAPSLALGDGLEIGPSELWEHKGTADFDLTLTVREGTPTLRCGLEYSTDLFAATTARRWVGHWRTLVAAIVAEPARPLSALPLLPAAERQQLLVEWNATQVPWPAAKSFPELFARRVACCGDACALESGDERLSYRELGRRASQVAHRLLELGVGPESRVGLALGRSAECLIAVLGILEAGAAYVPLDPSY
ncbi:MAG: condensation domain-containing protein, partial [Acidobacteriota bacterium]